MILIGNILIKYINTVNFSILDSMQKMRSQVDVDFMRTMNKLTFDRVVENDPKKFAFITMPEDEKKDVPEIGKMSFI